MGYIGFEIFNVMKELIQEIREEGGGGGFGTLISKSNTERLLTWMADPNPDKKPHPPYQVSSMMFQIALQLQASGVPLFSSSSNDATTSTSPPSIADILPRLTKPQAQLLTDCLLVPDPSVTLNQVYGYVQVRQALKNWIPRTRFNTDPTNTNTKNLENNPFAKFVAAHHQQGIMLYGPPGCGKSLLIKAFGGECHRPTLVIAPSTLHRKYNGESNQQVKMLWSLITDIFQNHVLLVLDELDGLFRERNDQENEVSREVKTEFLQLWDGVALKHKKQHPHNNNNLMVIGATNRPFDVDPAVARRLPQSFFIGLPPYGERWLLLHMWCREFQIPMGSDLVEQMAQATHLYTPSDLKQVLRQACQGGPLARGDLQLHWSDIQLAMEQVPATKLHSNYVIKMQQYMGVHHNHHGNHPNSNSNSNQHDADGDRHPIYKWETPMGYFLHMGHIPVDDSTLDVFDHMMYDTDSSSNDEGDSSEDGEEDDDL